jgi:hypothetical protein
MIHTLQSYFSIVHASVKRMRQESISWTNSKTLYLENLILTVLY